MQLYEASLNFWGLNHKNSSKLLELKQHFVGIKISGKAKYSAKEVFSVSYPLATDTLPLINSFVDHTVFYVGTDNSQTPLQFVDILYRSLVNAILNQPLGYIL